MKRYIYIFMLLLPVLTACEREIKYTGNISEAKLVIEAVACAGDSIVPCFVNRSYFFLESKPYETEAMTGVTLGLYTPTGENLVVADSIGGYIHYLRLIRPIRQDDSLTIMACHPDYETASAKDVVLPEFAPQLLSYVENQEDSLCKCTVLLPQYPYQETTIAISVSLHYSYTAVIDKNYPRQVNRPDTVVRSHESRMVCSHDMLFSQLNGYNANRGYIPRNGSLLFLTDNVSAGQVELNMPVSISAYETVGYNVVSYSIDSLVLDFTAQSEAYSLYMSSMRAYKGFDGGTNDEYDLGALLSETVGIEEPVPVYSNVENGYGCFITKTKTKIRIK